MSRLQRPDRLPEQVTVLDFPCPHCKARKGERCSGAERYRARGHAPRQDKAGKALMRASLAVLHHVDAVYDEAVRVLGQVEADRACAETFAARRSGDTRLAVALAADVLARCAAEELL